MPAAKKGTKKLKSNNVNGRKKILLVSVLALGVIGAAIVIRSFAATGEISYSVANNNLTTRSPGSVMSDGSKSGIKTIKLPRGATASAIGTITSPNGQVCAMVRADGNITSGAGIGISNGPISFLPISTSWVERCISYTRIGGADFFFSNSSSTNVYVSYIIYRPSVVTAPVNPTPAK